MEELQSEDKVISDQTAKQTAKRFKNKASSLTRHINETTIMEQEEECDPSISLEDHHKERHCSCACAANLPSPPVNSSVQKIPTTVLKPKDFVGDRNKELSGSNMELEGRMENKLARMRQMIENKVFSGHSRKNESNDKTAIEVGKKFRSWVRSTNRGANWIKSRKYCLFCYGRNKPRSRQNESYQLWERKLLGQVKGEGVEGKWSHRTSSQNVGEEKKRRSEVEEELKQVLNTSTKPKKKLYDLEQECSSLKSERY